MGGKEGNRGYLVQTIIALLESLNDDTWISVTIEPEHISEKVDVKWEGPSFRRLAQIKSSINQIGKSDAEQWATELSASLDNCTCELILVGPCSQSVAEMGNFMGVSVPCPRSLDLDGLLGQGAHLLDKFLRKEGLDAKSPYQREIMVAAIATKLSVLSSEAKNLSRIELVNMIKGWLDSITGPTDCSWEQVDFQYQRGIENAIAGKRLGPSDVRECPELSICTEIVKELDRSHIHEIVGLPGCGKSITAWHAAKKYCESGYSIWRPRASSTLEQLLADIPDSTPKLLVIDDAQRYGPHFANRISEISGKSTKVLLVSTIDTRLLPQVFCVRAEKVVDELKEAITIRSDEVLPIIKSYDDSVGDRYFETSFEKRIDESGHQKTPWEFFWFLRGGWQTAVREFESIKQFSSASDLLTTIAIGQIASCDAGVGFDWVKTHSQSIGISEDNIHRGFRHLEALGLITASNIIRTKHIRFASSVIERSLHHESVDSWHTTIAIFTKAVLEDATNFKGVRWLLNSAARSDAFRSSRRKEFNDIIDPVLQQCALETEDIKWAAGCFSSLYSAFELRHEKFMEHEDLVLGWCTSGCNEIAYFSSNILNNLINRSRDEKDPTPRDAAKEFIEKINVSELIERANAIHIDHFYYFGSLLDRLAFFGPAWASSFVSELDWQRIKEEILAADVERAFAIDKLVTGLCLLAEKCPNPSGLKFIEDITPYVCRTINERPSEAVSSMDGVFWTCLGYLPHFLRRGDGPDSEQTRVARDIVDRLDPKTFAQAMVSGVPRDLEGLARSLAVIQDVHPEYPTDISKHLNEGEFFEATAGSWKNQSAELTQLIRFFAFEKDYQPACSWIEKNQHRIEGDLKPTFACIAPNTAIDFHRAGKAVRIVSPGSPDWLEVNCAISRIHDCDRNACLEIVSDQIEELGKAVCHLSIDPLRRFLSFFRVLHELSPELFDQLIDAINLDDSQICEIIHRLVKNQRKQRKRYQSLAKRTQHIQGKGGTLATEFLNKLEQVQES